MADNKKPQYAFLPRKMKDVIDHVEPRQMHELLEEGCDTEFCYILGIIADMKQISGRVSADHEQILQIPQTLLRMALGGPRPLVRPLAMRSVRLRAAVRDTR